MEEKGGRQFLETQKVNFEVHNCTLNFEQSIIIHRL